MSIKLQNALFLDDNVVLSDNAINTVVYDPTDAVNGIDASTPNGPRAGMIAMLEASTGKSVIHKGAAGAYKAIRPLGMYRHDLRHSGADIGTGRQISGIIPEPGLTSARKLPIIRASATMFVDIFQDDTYAVGDLLYNDLAQGVLTNVIPTSQPSGGGARTDELAILLATADSDGYIKIHWILP